MQNKKTRQNEHNTTQQATHITQQSSSEWGKEGGDVFSPTFYPLPLLPHGQWENSPPQSILSRSPTSDRKANRKADRQKKRKNTQKNKNLPPQSSETLLIGWKSLKIDDSHFKTQDKALLIGWINWLFLIGWINPKLDVMHALDLAWGVGEALRWNKRSA